MTAPRTAAGAPLESLLATVTTQLDEGVQLWDVEGRMIQANAGTFRQLGVGAGDPAANHGRLRALMLTMDGGSFGETQFPVAQALAKKMPVLNTLVQVAHIDTPRWLRLNAYPVGKSRSNAAVLTTTVDVTDFVTQIRTLEKQAHFDALTLLPNRVLLADRLQQALARARRTNEMLAVCVVDLDGFKAVNDTLGHEAGDKLLQEVARRLRDCIRAEDTVARLSGDEFALLIGGVKTLSQAQQALSRVIELVAVPVTLDQRVVQVTASLGATLFPLDAGAPQELLTHADEAMYRAKQGGKDRFHLFDTTIGSRLRANQRIVRQMEQALASGEFKLHYQPIVDCQRGTVVGAEALVRWEHPVLGTRLPHEFLPLIEQEELSIRLSDWVIEQALHQNQLWREAGFQLLVDVNISPLHLLRGDLERLLTRLEAQQPGSPLAALRVEVVSSHAGILNDTAAAMDRCCKLGVGFVLDDFGDGHSTMPNLIALGAGTLKINRNYVRELPTNPLHLAIVRGLIGLGEAFQRRVVAVGAETVEQLLILLELGCPVIQGHAIARPLAAADVLPWLRAFRPDPRWRAAQLGFPTRSDFELLLLQAAHRNWFTRVVQVLQGRLPANSTRPEALTDCRITHWYEEVGHELYRNDVEFQAILAIHRELHAAVEDALEHAGTAARLADLERRSEDLLGRLHAFRVRVARRAVSNRPT